MRRSLAAACALAALLIAVPSASAATTSYDNATKVLTFNAAPGEFNMVSVTSSGTTNLVLTLMGGNTYSGGAPSGCAYSGGNTVATCNQAAPFAFLQYNGNDNGDMVIANTINDAIPFHVTGNGGADTILLGNGNDSVDLGSGDDSVLGGDGNDVLHGGPGNDSMSGEGGTDQLFGEAGDEVENGSSHFSGGNGADTLDGGSGDDTWSIGLDPNGHDAFIGGPGFDTVTAGNTVGPVTLSLNGVADDTVVGAAGADTPDNVGGADVEALVGALQFGDNLTGNDGPNVLDGGSQSSTNFDSADDTLNGAGGNDLLFGRGGNDTLNGDAGFDTLQGGAGDDALNGGSENDLLQGQAGSDALNGGDGNDTADWSDRNAIAVSFDGAANDGDAGDADNVANDVENVTGSPFSDTIGGSGAANYIVAGAGSDIVNVKGDEAIDQVDCGVGFDTVTADAIDLLLGDAAGRCESVDQPGSGGVISPTGSGQPAGGASGGSGGIPEADRTAAQVTVTGVKASYKRAAFLKGFTATISGNEEISVNASLRDGAMVLNERTLPFGTGARKLPLKPSKKLLGTRKKLTAKLVIQAIDRGGNATTVTKTIKVK